MLLRPSQTHMQRIQIRPLTGAVNLPLNIAAPGLSGMEGGEGEAGLSFSITTPSPHNQLFSGVLYEGEYGANISTEI